MPNMINLSFLRSLPVNYVQPFATVATHSTRQSLVSYRNTMSQKISKEGRTSKMFTCILQQQLYEGRRSTRPWPEVWHSPRLPRWDGPRSSKAPSWYRLKYVVRFLFALFRGAFKSNHWKNLVFCPNQVERESVLLLIFVFLVPSYLHNHDFLSR